MTEKEHTEQGGYTTDHTGTMAHVMPAGTLVAVFVTLIALTWLTVAATWYDHGNLNLIIAMAIATVKASLVALYFMHLRYDKPFNAIIFLVALVFVGLFVSITLLDTIAYGPEIENWPSMNSP